jgi:Protein of unknown function (DUF1549)/Protein of unknown function (DUF1553)
MPVRKWQEVQAVLRASVTSLSTRRAAASLVAVAAIAMTWPPQRASAVEWVDSASEKLIPPLPLEPPEPMRMRGSFNNDIDRFIAMRWKETGARPAPLADDMSFVRRVYLDIAGVIPTADQARAFADAGYNKRAKLIDRLLASPRYADHWAVFWGDLFREQTRIRGTDPFTLRDYIRDALNKNKPYDDWVREMLSAKGTARDNPAVAFGLRNGSDRNDITIATTQVFLGIQLKCAQCHDHPFEAWEQNDFVGVRKFFQGTRSKRAFEEEVERNGRTVRRPIFELVDVKPGRGTFVTGKKSSKGRGREGLADLVVDRRNRYFARVAVNRLWAALFGRGLVDPPDAFSPKNPPSHPKLLDWLALDFIAHGHDLKHTLRLICNSRTYQLASRGGRRPGEIGDDVGLFERMALRRLTAEQLHDSILITSGLAGSERRNLRPAIEKRYPARAGSFLEIFDAHDRLTIHQRDATATIPQALTLLNGDLINRAVAMHKRHPVRLQLEAGVSRRRVVESLFLATLTREPTAAERKWSLEAAQDAKGWSDVHWALINSREFMFIR